MTYMGVRQEWRHVVAYRHLIHMAMSAHGRPGRIGGYIGLIWPRRYYAIRHIISLSGIFDLATLYIRHIHNTGR